MSSLRLALKQSLQESGGGLPEKRKQKKRSKEQQQTNGMPQPPRRKRRPGDPPRKRGRPRKHPLPEDVQQNNSQQASNDANHGDDHHESAKESSDEENEFSDSMASMMDNEDDDDDDDDGVDEDQERGDQQQNNQKQHSHEQSSDQQQEHNQQQQQQQQQQRERTSEPGEGDDEEDLRMARRKRKRLLKKMKRNSAANTIQSQWKKKKGKADPSSPPPPPPPASENTNGNNSSSNGRPVSPKPPKKQTQQQESSPPQQPETPDAEESESATTAPASVRSSSPVPKPKKAVNKTVPPPAVEIIDWVAGMSVKKQRRNMSAGLRVKVRFATKIKKRDGKIVRKHKWYGGLVTAMSSGGSKIRIKYDDTTTEVAKYPDKDIIVDDESNDVHQAVASAFIPPVDESEDDENNPSSMELADSSTERRKKPKKMLPSSSHNTPKPSADEIPDDWRAGSSAPPKPRSDTPVRCHETEMTDDTNDGNVSEGAMQVEETSQGESNTERPKFSAADESNRPETEVDDTTNNDAKKGGDERADATEKRPLSPKPKPKNITERERDISNSSTGSDSRPSAATSKESRIDKHMADDEDDDSSDDDGPMEIIAQGTGAEIMIPQPAILIEKTSSALYRSGTGTSDDDDDDDILTATAEKREKSIEEREKVVSRKAEADNAGAATTNESDEEDESNQMEVENNAELRDFPSAKEDKKRAEFGSATQEKFQPIVEEEPEDEMDDAAIDSVEEIQTVKEDDAKVIISKQSEVPKSQKRKREDRGRSPKPSKSMTSTPVPKHPKRESSPVPMVSEFNNNIPNAVVAKPVPTSISADPTLQQEDEPIKVESPQIVSSQHSAFAKKSEKLKLLLKDRKLKLPAQSSNDEPRASTPTIDKTDLSSIQRSGRRAAQQANERIASRQELVIQESFSKPKKKKGDKFEGKPAMKDRKRKEPEGGIDVTDDENQWVQCDTCSKWRVLPSTVDVDKLPNQWYCEMNIYDPLHNSCDSAEQTPEEIAKAKRKAKRRQVRRARLEAEAAAAAAVTGEEVEPVKEKEPKPSRKIKSPMPDVVEKREPKAKKEEKEKRTEEGGKKRPAPTTASEEEGIVSSESNSGSDQIKEAKKARRSRSQEEEAGVVEVVKGKPRGRRRGKEGKDKEGKGGKGAKGLEDNQEWVQCEKCEKWRRLPPHIAADDLPDVWYCSMNTWDDSTNTCGAAEDKADPNTVNVSGAGGGHGGHKLSYRSLIFGTGKKQNRTISERTRAAESLFSSHTYGDPDTFGSHPRVMYATSSMFVGRTNPRAEQERVVEKISFLELMSHSNLWTELRGLGKRLNDQGPYAGSRKILACRTNDPYSSLPTSLKREMKELVFHALGSSTMASHEVLLEAQCRPWEGVPAIWTELRATCTVDSVVACLLELVGDGRVEVTPTPEYQMSVLEAMPRFRRVMKSPQLPPLQPEEEEENEHPVKSSRCMKISKPWKNMHVDA